MAARARDVPSSGELALSQPGHRPESPQEPQATVPEPPDVNWPRLFALLAAGLCLLKLAILVAYSLTIEYVMDEFSQGGYSINIGTFYRTLIPPKTVLYAYLYDLARLVSSSSSGLMRAARLETDIFVLVMLWMSWTLWRRVGFSSRMALFALCVVLSYSNFLERSFRVRSDTVALLFDVAAVMVICGASRLSVPRVAMGGLLVGMAFLSTQKAGFAAVSIGAAITVSALTRDGLRRYLALAAACLGVFCLTLAAYAIYFGGGNPLDVLLPVYEAPQYLIRHGAEYYPQIGQYRLQTLARNWHLYLLSVIGWATAIRSWRTADGARRFALVFAAVFSIFIFTFDQPWPYVFVSAIIFLGPWSVECISAIPEHRGRTRLAAEVVLLLLCSISLSRNFRYFANSNSLQNAVTDQAEALLRPADTYEDGTGMITTRKLAGNAWWDGMVITQLLYDASQGNTHYFSSMIQDQPKVWIINYRVEALRPIDARFIVDSYVRVAPNILLAGSPLDGFPRKFVVRWGGSYAVYGPAGPMANSIVLVNGRPAATPLRLRAGTVYQLSLPGQPREPLALLPADVPIHYQPVLGPPAELYVSPYG